MATGDFDVNYGSDPWANLDKNERQWYDPDLVRMFRQKSAFRDAVPFTKNMGAKNAKTMTVSQLFDVHANNSALSLRQLWLPASHIDSRAIDITFSRYGGKTAYHKYDDLVTYWQADKRGGLRNIIRGALGQHMIDVLDILARNAFIDGALSSGYSLYTGSAADFDDFTPAAGEEFDPDIAADVWLGMSYRDVPSAQGINGAGASIVCYTSPGVIYDIQSDSGWIGVQQYANPSALLAYEAGAYKNVRFVQTPKCTLWNCGSINVRANVTSPISAGDGSPDPSTTSVDGAYKTGQDGATHYIQLQSDAFASGEIADLAAGSIVTIHSTVTSDNGVTDGVDYTEGKLHNRRVVSLDAANFRIALDRPIMEDFSTDLGSGVYAYVTAGIHVHASVFVANPYGLVSGVAQAPQIHTPLAVDDFESMQRFSWDAYMGYQLFNPEVFEVVFSVANTRVKGAKAYVGAST